MKNSEFYTTVEEREDAFRSYVTGMTFRNYFVCAQKAIEWLNMEAEGVHKVYDGTKIRIFGWSIPCVIDLTGCRTMDVSVCDLLTTSDDSEHANNLGQCRVVIRSDGIYAKTDRAKATGYSVGVEVEGAERIDTGSRKINGQNIEAPFYHVTKSVLSEVMELPDENNVRLSQKSDEVVELEKRVADLERENAESKTRLEIKNRIEVKYCILEDALHKLVEAVRPFCLERQKFNTLLDCLHNAERELAFVEEKKHDSK